MVIKCSIKFSRLGRIPLSFQLPWNVKAAVGSTATTSTITAADVIATEDVVLMVVPVTAVVAGLMLPLRSQVIRKLCSHGRKVHLGT